MTFKRRVNDTIEFYINFISLSNLLKLISMSKTEKILNWILTIATAIAAFVQYIISHAPKTPIILAVITINSVQAQSTRVYPIKSVIQESHPTQKSFLTINESITKVDSSIFIGPSVSFDLFSHEFKSGITSFGALPGIGYGIKYNPYHWKNAYLIGIDFFANTGIIKEQNNEPPRFFDIELVPVITVFGYAHFGVGYRWKIGLNGNQNDNTAILVSGVSIPLP